MSFKEFVKKKRVFISYCLFGFLASALETGLYSLFYITLNFSNVLSTCISWVLTVIFAFFTNKCNVYRSKEWKLKVLGKEILAFFSCRLTSGVFNLLWMYIFVDHLKCNGVLMKIVSALLVGVFNYLMGKIVIFSKSKKSQQKSPQSI